MRALLAAGLMAAGVAHAHAIGLSRGDYRLDGSAITFSLGISRNDLSGGPDPLVVARSVGQRVTLFGDGRPCPLAVGAVTPEGNGVAVQGRADCGVRPTQVSLAWGAFNLLPQGHRHLARLVLAEQPIDAVLYASNPRAVARVGEPPGLGRTLYAFGRLGVIHILTGYDHLAFLCALILVGARRRRLVGLVTAFTVAHSLTLSAAVLGVLEVSSRWVEAAIALSIVYVAVENWFVKTADHRWKLTFLFGLVHGMGFASALREISIPSNRLPLALVSFNGGVELGQLSVLAVVLPLLALARRSPWFVARGVKAVSGAIGLTGFVWLVQRLS